MIEIKPGLKSTDMNAGCWFLKKFGGCHPIHN